MSRIHYLVRWSVIVILSAVFGFYGVIELMGKMSATFIAWGYPGWFVYLVGAIQVAGAAGLYYEKTVRLFTFLFAVIAASAALTYVGHHESILRALPPIALLLLSFGLIYLNVKYFSAKKQIQSDKS